jgi:hypothetical protein
MQIMHRGALPGNVPDARCRQVHDRALATVKWTLEQALDEEVRASLGCARYARPNSPWEPKHTRSGASARQLWTQYGGIPTLRVPKLRRGNRQLEWQTSGRYERWGGPWLAQQLWQYGLGHSLRDLQESIGNANGLFHRPPAGASPPPAARPSPPRAPESHSPTAPARRGWRQQARAAGHGPDGSLGTGSLRCWGCRGGPRGFLG